MPSDLISPLLSALSLDDPNVRQVLVGVMLCAGSSALVGSFALLRRRALAGDAIAHAVLPGICLAFLVQGSKEPLGLIIGAFVTGALSVGAVDYLARHTRIREDAALALVLSVFFGAGILLLTHIQHQGMGAQSGLDRFLFGKAAALSQADVVTFGALALVLTLAVVFLQKEFTLLSFDPAQARVLGLPVRALELTLSALTVLAVVVGIQAVGVVLMAALLFMPAAAARYWTHRITALLALAALFGVCSGAAATYLSLAAPAMPTGPWMVVALAAITLASLLFAPERGLAARALRRYRQRRQMAEENVLKALYQLSESLSAADTYFDEPALRGRNAPLRPLALTPVLRRLEGHGDIVGLDHRWRLTDAGRIRARRLVRLHRLWETYLTQRLRLAPDHVHDDAETIEHILTPELEAELERILDRPTADPHQRHIPY